MIFKNVLNKHEFNFVISNDGIYEINSRKNKLGFGGNPASEKLYLKINLSEVWCDIR